MNKFNIITLSRTFGSGGKGIGKRLAKNLGFAFYDNEIKKEASAKTGLDESYFDAERTAKSSLLYSLAMGLSGGQNSMYGNDTLSDERLFAVQSEIIREKADAGNCVFVGRCAGYVLRHYDNCLNVYINADMDDRIRTIAKRYDIDEAAALKEIKKKDKNRKSYYTYYTNRSWGDTTDYHLCLNISKIGEDGAVELIKNYLELAKD